MTDYEKMKENWAEVAGRCAAQSRDYFIEALRWMMEQKRKTPDKQRDEIGYVPKDDPRLNTIIGPPRLPDKCREE
jgi:hypothetical protein